MVAAPAATNVNVFNIGFSSTSPVRCCRVNNVSYPDLIKIKSKHMKRFGASNFGYAKVTLAGGSGQSLRAGQARS